MECVDGVCKFVPKSQRGDGQKAGEENNENAAPGLPLVAVGDKLPMPLPLEQLEEGGKATTLQSLCSQGGKGGRVVVLGKGGGGGDGMRLRGHEAALPCRLPAPSACLDSFTLKALACALWTRNLPFHSFLSSTLLHPSSPFPLPSHPTHQTSGPTPASAAPRPWTS